MKKYTEMTPQERQAEYAAVKAKFEQLKGMGLSLNMARGKPGKAQLDLVTPIFGLLTKPEDFVSDGIDVRNYGEMTGLPAAKRLFADILGCKPEQVFVGGMGYCWILAAVGLLSIFLPFADGVCRRDPWNWEYGCAQSGVEEKKALLEKEAE